MAPGPRPEADLAPDVWVLWAGSTMLSGNGGGPIDGFVGLIQRVYLVVAFAWVALVGARLADRAR